MRETATHQMTSQKKSSTTKLPQSLIEQIKVSECRSDFDLVSLFLTLGLASHEHHRRIHPGARKEARKRERTLRKQKKAQYFSHSNADKKLKRSADEEHVECPKTKKSKVDHISEPVSKQTLKEKRPKVPVKPLKAPTLPKVRSKVEENEDAYITYLESKLGLRKAERINKKGSENDGLDGMSPVHINHILELMHM